jgi:hypothetical protein
MLSHLRLPVLLAALLLLSVPAVSGQVPAIRADAFLSTTALRPGEPLAYSVVVSDSVDESFTFSVHVTYDAARLSPGAVVRFPRAQPCDGTACAGSFGERADVGKDRIFTFLFTPAPGACGTVQPLVAEVRATSTIRLISEEIEIVCQQRLPMVTR